MAGLPSVGGLPVQGNGRDPRLFSASAACYDDTVGEKHQQTCPNAEIQAVYSTHGAIRSTQQCVSALPILWGYGCNGLKNTGHVFRRYEEVM